jgi:ABC-2 type transport system ATP-binding protein
MRPAEIYGVIGANGSGKSTLIRMLSTQLLPDEGTIEVFGLDVVREAGAVRALINRVSADPSFFRGIAPLGNLSVFGGAYGLSRTEARSRSRQILDRLGLERDRLDE